MARADIKGLLVLVVTAVWAIIVYLFCAYLSYLELGYARWGQTADATITRIIEPRNVTPRSTRWVEFRFIDSAWTTHFGGMAVGMNDPCPSIDQSIAVQYIPGTDHSRVLGQSYMLAANIFVLVTVAVGGLALLYIFWFRRQPHIIYQRTPSAGNFDFPVSGEMFRISAPRRDPKKTEPGRPRPVRAV